MIARVVANVTTLDQLSLASSTVGRKESSQSNDRAPNFSEQPASSLAERAELAANLDN
jgi:hypothetical protein